LSADSITDKCGGFEVLIEQYGFGDPHLLQDDFVPKHKFPLLFTHKVLGHCQSPGLLLTSSLLLVS
jgi:hypothetical protein